MTHIQTMTYTSTFLQTIAERGFIHQCTDFEALDALLTQHEKEGKPLVAYIGFDCTAPSLHVGSLIQIMILRWLQKCGHQPIVLMGGGTTKVGDPSGKDKSRQLLNDAAIAANMAGIKSVFEKFLAFEDSCHPAPDAGSNLMPHQVRHDNIGHNSGASDNKALMVNNDDWLSGLNYIAFLRDYGRHFSVNHMLSMESVKQRLERESHLSFLEFNYMILQAYDFVELAKRHTCRLQIGGSDQWGNIVNGVELHRRIDASLRAERSNPSTPVIPAQAGIHKHRPEHMDSRFRGNDDFPGLFGLTTPLLTTSSGAKMGKTADGAVWLNGEMFSPYDYWQFWRNVEDDDVKRFLLLFTELPVEEIEALTAHRDQRMNEAKKILATEATKLLHGEEAALAAAETARKTFEEGAAGDALPVHNVPQAELEAGIAYFKLLADSGLVASGKEARRAVDAGAACLNDVKITDANQKVTTADMKDGIIKISASKKKHAVIKLA